MGSLEDFRNNLMHEIEESLGLIKTVNVISSHSGLPVNLSAQHRDFIVEWSFVKIHVAWESFLESCFIAYMLGVQTASGFSPSRYILPTNEQHALGIVLAGREYFPWTAPGAVRSQSILCFKDGQPFRQILDSTATELKEINTLRNAIVHRSRVAIDKFKSLVRDKMLTAPLEISPASFLLSTKSGTVKRNYLSHYCNKLKIVANKIVPT